MADFFFDWLVVIGEAVFCNSYGMFLAQYCLLFHSFMFVCTTRGDLSNAVTRPFYRPFYTWRVLSPVSRGMTIEAKIKDRDPSVFFFTSSLSFLLRFSLIFGAIRRERQVRGSRICWYGKLWYGAAAHRPPARPPTCLLIYLRGVSIHTNVLFLRFEQVA